MNTSADRTVHLPDSPHNQRIARGQRFVDLIAYVLLMFATALGFSVALGGVVLLLASPASAAQSVEAAQIAMKPADARQGTLLFRGDQVASFAVPLLGTEVDIQVSGPLAHTRVVQTFSNPSDAWYEGIYVFPLPDNAAVSRLRMRIGERVVEAEVQERARAQATYQQARRAGQRAALLEQERPNMFTTSVANIGPREQIVIELEYRQTLDYRQTEGAGRYSLRFPMVVGPRYIPGAGADDEEVGAVVAGARIDDALRISPPVLGPAERVLNPVRIRVSLDAGVPIAELNSPFHSVQVIRDGERRRRITLSEGNTPANRDFELTWTLAAGSAPTATLFSEPGEHGRHYALLTLMPPAPFTTAARLPREVIFVVDTSGSMEGESIAQAREALALALRRLDPADRFNVIEFNSDSHALFDDARAASDANVQDAVRWVERLRARGGTEMAGALDKALTGKDRGERVRQVIFLTDGAVGNEQALFTLIQQRLGASRLFTVGIGSAPNSHFMRKAAEAGRGNFTYIGKVDEVKTKMSALFALLEAPMLKNVEVRWPAGARVESWPARVPDLYLGEPIVLAAALDTAAGQIEISGDAGELRWTTSVSLADANPGTGIGSLWARQKIDALMDRLNTGSSEEEVRAAVVPLAVEHHLASRYTSFVAVDRSPARPAESRLEGGAMPTNMPHGWDHQAVFGELPRGATDSRWHLLLGSALLALAFALWLAMARRTDNSSLAH